jgi:hypothetical protein
MKLLRNILIVNGFDFFIQPFYGGKAHQVTAEVRDQTGALECKVQGEWNSHYEFMYSNVSSNVSKILH